MALEHLTHNDLGELVSPQTAAEWDAWLGASRTRNFCKGMAVVDWLDRYGEAHGFVPAVLDPRTDFGQFIMAKGHAFEAALMPHLRARAEVVEIPRDGDGSRSLASAVATWDAMVSGAEVIYQGVLRNPQDRTYGAPDLLVRSDVLARLFPEAIADCEIETAAPALMAPWHYRVVDIKYSTLHLDRTGHLASAKKEFMVQVSLYNRALGRVQGYEPPSAYIMGRGWEQTVCGETLRGRDALERLARIDRHYTPARAAFSLPNLVDEALAWHRRLRAEGAGWALLPRPSIDELRPVSGEDYGRWGAVAKRVLQETRDITLAWQAGVPARERALAAGVETWDDPRCTAELLEISGECRAPMVDRVLSVNRDTAGPAIVPQVIRAEAETWARPGAVEFFVDFETVSNLDDDFSALPLANGEPSIFMVGCGHIEGGEWRFACFIADGLGAAAEGRVIEDWLAHMAAVKARLDPTGPSPLVFHWSPAEASALSNAYNSARERHMPASLRWVEPTWFDFLGRVMKAKNDHVVVRGAMGFGLKAVARALHGQGLVATLWGDTITDGLGAMTGAWWADAEARRLGVPFAGLELVREIAAYNEVDCRVMWETITALRARTPQLR
jgi:hypothetical protein